MKPATRFLLPALALVLGLPAAAQEAQPKEPWLLVGPRAGVSWVMADAGVFDKALQELSPSERSYFPLYSELGLSLAQHVRLPPGKFRLTIQEALSVRGLDQNYALPALSLLVGVHRAPGLEISLGPELIFPPNGEVQLALIYTLGWRFSFKGASLPLLLVLSPLPQDRLGRLSLLSGIDFAFRPKLPKISRKKTPFNY